MQFSSGGGPVCTCSCNNDSEQPVRYADGELLLRETDLSLSAFGMTWGHARSFSNTFQSAYNGINGINWYSNYNPYLIAHGKGLPRTIVLMTNPREALWFDQIGGTGTYGPRFNQKSSIAYDVEAEEYVVTDATGNRILFYGFSIPRKGGQFKGVIQANGIVSIASYDANDRIVALEFNDAGQSAKLDYEYLDRQSYPGKIISVTQSTNGSSVRRASYAYYSQGEKEGLPEALKTVVIEQYDAAAKRWNALDTFYYRYYTVNNSKGYAYGLKYAVGPDAYSSLVADGISPERATDSQLKGYADFYFEYDWQRRVTLETVRGGGYTYSFQYENNPKGTRSFNVWTTKTTETLPDQTTNIVYSNAFSLIVVKIKKAEDMNWGVYYEYDNRGRKRLQANASAIASYDESTPGVAILSTDKGLVQTYEYYGSDDPDGQPQGYLRYESVQQGSAGEPQPLTETRYFTHTVGYESIHPVSERIAYQSSSGDFTPVSTLYTYDSWHKVDDFDTFQPQQVTTILPSVHFDQNGTGEENALIEIFGQNGQRTWIRDARGFLTMNVNDALTGASTLMIEDVDTNVASAPNGWKTPIGGGLHLITEYDNDALGRRTQVLGPVHELDLDGVATLVRRTEWTVYADDKDRTLKGKGYATGLAGKYEFTLINPVVISVRDFRNRILEEISATRADRSGPLSSQDRFPQSSYCRWRTVSHDHQGLLVSERHYFLIPKEGSGWPGTNFNETSYRYDISGRKNRELQPSGTLLRWVREPRGLITSRWIGTNDVGASDSDPGGGGVAGNNMRRIETKEYDGGGSGGNGNLTKQVLLVNSESVDDRNKVYEYDYRNRRISSVEPNGDALLINTTQYDNMDRSLVNTSYSDSATPERMISETRSFYDNLGRIYRKEQVSTDAQSKKESSPLSLQKWYDFNDNVIKESALGASNFAKTEYDGLGRATIVYRSCCVGSKGVPQGDTNDVSNDTVIEQTETRYDPAGNAILLIQRNRFDDVTGLGALGTVTQEPKARVSWIANWHDGIGRLKTTADYGTNAGANLERPGVPPARSDTILVSSSTYKDAGEESATVGPNGVENRSESDALGRRIRRIENFVKGDTAKSRITDYTWHPSAKLESQTVHNEKTGDQVTRWVFGSSLTDSEISDNNLVVKKISPAGAVTQYCWNRQRDTIRRVEADRTTHRFLYDRSGKQVADYIETISPTLDNSIMRIEWSFDNRGLLSHVTTFDSAAGGNIVNEVAFDYDAFSNITSDSQSHAGAVAPNSPRVIYNYADGSSSGARQVSLTYPSGASVNFTYGAQYSIDDHFDRISALAEDGREERLVSYTYMGFRKQVHVAYEGPAIELTYKRKPEEPDGDAGDQYTGYDRFGRTVKMNWRKTDTESGPIEQVLYAFDRGSRRTSYGRGGTTGLESTYTYDGLGQITKATLNAVKDNSPGERTSEQSAEEWDYDSSGNWIKYTNADSGGPPREQLRSHRADNALSAINDDKECVSTDEVGRMTKAPPNATGDWTESQLFKWDAWGRITEVRRGSDGVMLAQYAYDGTGRRIVSEVGGQRLHSYFSKNLQILEQCTEQDSPSVRYYWGVRHFEDLVKRTTYSAGGELVDTARFVIGDYFNPVAIVDRVGLVQQRYRFSAFGNRTTMTSDWKDIDENEITFNYGFCGHFIDGETGLMNFGFRYLANSLGRWLCKDPIEEADGANLYLAMHNDPTNNLDILGLLCTAAEYFDSLSVVPHGANAYNNHIGHWMELAWATNFYVCGDYEKATLDWWETMVYDQTGPLQQYFAKYTGMTMGSAYNVTQSYSGWASVAGLWRHRPACSGTSASMVDKYSLGIVPGPKIWEQNTWSIVGTSSNLAIFSAMRDGRVIPAYIEVTAYINCWLFANNNKGYTGWFQTTTTYTNGTGALTQPPTPYSYP